MPSMTKAAEITDSVIMQNVESTTEILTRLNELGLDLSIDDFGTGYSSHSYLERFPVKRINIDKSFVDDIGQGTDSEAIAKAVITLGHSLSMQVMAEGVKSEDQVAYLRNHACNEIQGYFYNEPISVEEFPDIVERFSNNN
tara:strand:- start:2866 stop:3288 length:423 start_codon:yes stop_codon:yes gene_type:complete